MGRKRTNNYGLPPRMALKSGSYYHVSSSMPRKWTPLGKDLNEARRKWAGLEDTNTDEEDKSFAMVARRYMREVLPTLSNHTQRDYTQYCALLNSVFGQVPIDKIRPFDIAEYLRIRGMKSKVRANR